MTLKEMKKGWEECSQNTWAELEVEFEVWFSGRQKVLSSLLQVLPLGHQFPCQ